MSEAVFSDVETSEIIFIFDVVPVEQGTNGVEVRHGAGVSTMVGPRLPRRIQYNATLVTPGRPDALGRTTQIVNTATRPVRPSSLLRQLEEGLLGRKVHIDSEIQPHRDVEWVVEFINPSIGEQDGKNVIHVNIAAIEEFDQDAVFDVVTIKVPVPPELQDEETDEGEDPTIDPLSGEVIGANKSCQPVGSFPFLVGGILGTIGGATSVVGASAVGVGSLIIDDIQSAGKAAGKASRSAGRGLKKGWKSLGDAVFGRNRDTSQTFSEGFEQGVRIGQEGRGACRT